MNVNRYNDYFFVFTKGVTILTDSIFKLFLSDCSFYSLMWRSYTDGLYESYFNVDDELYGHYFLIGTSSNSSISFDMSNSPFFIIHGCYIISLIPILSFAYF